MVDYCLEKIRKFAENCTSLQGFLMFNSVGGGTGSGFGSLLLERLSESYSKTTKFGITVYPSPQISTSVVAPYNTVFSTSNLIEHSNVVFMMDNEALYEICNK